MAPTNAAVVKFGLQMDSTEVPFNRPKALGNAHNYMKLGSLEVVAREGFGGHYTMSLPIAGIYLNPKLDQILHPALI